MQNKLGGRSGKKHPIDDRNIYIFDVSFFLYFFCLLFEVNGVETIIAIVLNHPCVQAPPPGGRVPRRAAVLYRPSARALRHQMAGFIRVVFSEPSRLLQSFFSIFYLTKGVKWSKFWCEGVWMRCKWMRMKCFDPKCEWVSKPLLMYLEFPHFWRFRQHNSDDAFPPCDCVSFFWGDHRIVALTSAESWRQCWSGVQPKWCVRHPPVQLTDSGDCNPEQVLDTYAFW